MIGTNVWFLNSEDRYLFGKVINENENGQVEVMVENTGVKMQTTTDKLKIANTWRSGSSAAQTLDLTALRHINEPEILNALKERSYSGNPYTFLGPVLVSVNPIIPDGSDAGYMKANNFQRPHPFSIGEICYRRVHFNNLNTFVNQSVLIAGESGSGKTEVCNRVLSHLITKSQTVASTRTPAELKQVLLSTSPLLESFGNAATVRNHNSSRFGKFTKLLYEIEEDNKSLLTGVSVTPYLLELSRLSHHDAGERTFHILYALLTGLKNDDLSKYHLVRDHNAYNFTRCSSSVMNRSNEEHSDKQRFQEVVSALETIGLSEESPLIWAILAAILHIGNIVFEEQSTDQGHTACISEDSVETVECAARLLQIEYSQLETLICKRRIIVKGEEPYWINQRLIEAVDSRDAVAKYLYSKLFKWIILKLNQETNFRPINEQVEQHGVGVLDIFGFESFRSNDFEQLLINLANEVLQRSFESKILEAEALVYQQEGFCVDPGLDKVEPMNDQHCLMLLVGGLPGYRGFRGVLRALEIQGEGSNPTDASFLNDIHSACKTHPKYVKVHPKDASSKFAIRHYAGDVEYTIGHFVAKNTDTVPALFYEILGNSSAKFVTDIVGSPTGKQGSKKKTGIAAKFAGQIQTLIADLEASQCSFIRCIKPNHALSRKHNQGAWFDSSYVLPQLRYLGVSHTAVALNNGGYPMRLEYEELVRCASKMLPPAVLEKCDRLSQSCMPSQRDEETRRKILIGAILQSYELPSGDYRCGKTKVFFTFRAVERLDNLLNMVPLEKHSEQSKKIESSTVRYLASKAIRVCVRKVLAAQSLLALLQHVREVRIMKRNKSAVRIQSIWRMVSAIRSSKRLRVERTNAATRLQALARGRMARQAFTELVERKKLSLRVAEVESMRNSPKLEQKQEIGLSTDQSSKTSGKTSDSELNQLINLGISDSDETRRQQLALLRQYAKAEFPDPETLAVNFRKSVEIVNAVSSGKFRPVAKDPILQDEGMVPPRPPKSRQSIMKQTMFAKIQKQQSLESCVPQKNHLHLLYANEKVYGDVLDTILDYYYHPLLQACHPNGEDKKSRRPVPILSKPDIDVVFSNIVQVAALHSNLVQLMHQILYDDMESSSMDQCLQFSLDLLNMLQFVKTIYGAYVREHTKSTLVFMKQKSSNTKFRNFLTEVSSSQGHPCFESDLKELLAAPLSRMQRYVKFVDDLLADIKDVTDERIVGIHTLKHELEDTKESFQDCRLTGVQEMRQSQIAARLTFGHKSDMKHPVVNVCAPGRKYIREWNVEASFSIDVSSTRWTEEPSDKKMYTFFLFSDILLVTHAAQHGKYELCVVQELSNLNTVVPHNNSYVDITDATFPMYSLLYVIFNDPEVTSRKSTRKSRVPILSKSKSSAPESTIPGFAGKFMTIFFKCDESRESMVDAIAQAQQSLAFNRQSHLDLDMKKGSHAIVATAANTA